MQKSYPSLYACVHVRNTKFYVVPGDLIHCYRLKKGEVGDIVQFDQVTEIGTRDHTLKGGRMINPKYFRVTGIII